MDSERGQATVEWTGLVLLVAVAFGALLALASSLDGRSLGGAVAHAITCAARGGCAAAGRALGVPARPVALRGRLSTEPGHAVAPPRRVQPEAPRTAPPPPRASPSRPRSRRPPKPAGPPSRAGPVRRSLRGAESVAKRAWLLCLGYRRFRYDLEQPRSPAEAMPLGEALDIANECFNPLGFLLED